MYFSEQFTRVTGEIYLDLSAPSEGTLLRRFIRRLEEQVEEEESVYLLVRQTVEGALRLDTARVEAVGGVYRACFAKVGAPPKMEFYLEFAAPSTVTVIVHDDDGENEDGTSNHLGITRLTPARYVGAPAWSVTSLAVARCSKHGVPLELSDL